MILCYTQKPEEQYLNMMEIHVCTVLYVLLGAFYSGQLYLNKGNAPDLVIAQNCCSLQSMLNSACNGEK